MDREIEHKIADIRIDRKSSTPIYHQLKEGIKSVIADVDLPPGTQLPSLRKVGNILSISFLTVSKTINEMANEGLLKTVEGFGTYTVGISNRILPPVGLLLGDTKKYMYASFLESITEELGKYGADVIVHNSQNNRGSFIRRLVEKRKTSGIIVYGEDIFQENDYVTEIISKIPVVLLGFPGSYQVDAAVCSDDEISMKLTVDAILKRKLDNVYYFASSQNISVGKLRRELFEKYARDAGLNYTIVDNVEYYDSGYLNAMRLVVEEKIFSAIVCWTDDTAAGVMQFLNKQGIKIPEQVAVIGYGNLDYSAKLFPPLTTIDQDFGEMGRIAAKALLAAMEKRTYDTPLLIKTKTTLIERESI